MPCTPNIFYNLYIFLFQVPCRINGLVVRIGHSVLLPPPRVACGYPVNNHESWLSARATAVVVRLLPCPPFSEITRCVGVPPEFDERAAGADKTCQQVVGGSLLMGVHPVVMLKKLSHQRSLAIIAGDGGSADACRWVNYWWWVVVV